MLHALETQSSTPNLSYRYLGTKYSLLAGLIIGGLSVDTGPRECVALDRTYFSSLVEAFYPEQMCPFDTREFQEVMPVAIKNKTGWNIFLTRNGIYAIDYKQNEEKYYFLRGEKAFRPIKMGSRLVHRQKSS